MNPYVTNQYVGHGFLDVNMTNDGRSLFAMFYTNDGSVRDQFRIHKSRQ
jgi:hypothetical protein